MKRIGRYVGVSLVVILIVGSLLGCPEAGTDGGGSGGGTTPDGSSSSSAISLTLGSWREDSITANSQLWFSADVTPDSTYRISWDDLDGSGDYNANVVLHVYQDDGSTAYFEQEDSGHGTNPDDTIYRDVTISSGESTIYVVADSTYYSSSGDFRVRAQLLDSDNDGDDGTVDDGDTEPSWVQITDEETFTNDGYDKIGLAASSNGNVVLAYLNATDGLDIRTYGGESWTSIDGSSIDNIESTNFVDMSVDGSNVFVGYKDSDSSATLAHYDGSTWSTTSAGDSVFGIDVEVANNVPYLLYTDQKTSFTWFPTVRSETSLTLVGDRYLDESIYPEDVAYSYNILDLEIAGSTLYLTAIRNHANTTQNADTVDLFRYTGGSWSLLEEQVVEGTFYNDSDAVDSVVDKDSNLLIGYLKDGKVSIRMYDGATWSDHTTDFTAREGYANEKVSLVRGLDDNLYMVIDSSYDYGSVYVFKYDDTEWTMLGGNRVWSGDSTSWYGTRVTADANGVAYISRVDTSDDVVDVWAFR